MMTDDELIVEVPVESPEVAVVELSVEVYSPDVPDVNPVVKPLTDVKLTVEVDSPDVQ